MVQRGLAELIGLEALLQTAVAFGELLLLVLQLGLQSEVLLRQGSVADQRRLLALLNFLHLKERPTVRHVFMASPLYFHRCGVYLSHDGLKRNQVIYSKRVSDENRLRNQVNVMNIYRHGDRGK